MRIVETSDGMITVIELDPTKFHWIIADVDAMSRDRWAQVRKVDGMILLKQPGSRITIVEGEKLPEGLRLFQY